MSQLPQLSRSHFINFIVVSIILAHIELDKMKLTYLTSNANNAMCQVNNLGQAGRQASWASSVRIMYGV